MRLKTYLEMYIFMNSCKLQGGLGNQLFQIFTTISYSLQHSTSFFFLSDFLLNSGENGETIRYTYWNTFLEPLKPFLKDINQVPELIHIKEKGFHYEELPENTDKTKGILLVGYFQSPKYFDKYKPFICKLLKLEQQKCTLTDKLNGIFNETTTISIHFRLGDYKNYSNLYYLLQENYYIHALTYIKNHNDFEHNKNILVLYFCEDESVEEVEKMLENIMPHFPEAGFRRGNVIYNNVLSDWEQMLLMSMCKHNIIANSTFSWWGAYLNNYTNKIVCYPETWFVPKVKHNITDLFPDQWVPISCS